jgi:hypothetical protein
MTEMQTVDDIVNSDVTKNKGKPWNKLDKSIKYTKIMEFVETYSQNENLNGERASQLKSMLRDRLGRKCLQRVRDVVYDALDEKIISIPALVFNNNKYTLRSEPSALLSALAPKNKTIRKKEDL